MYQPWIPHFGNHIPYTTREEDRVIELEKQLEQARKEIEKS